MKHQHAINETSDLHARWTMGLRATAMRLRDWATRDGLVWLHLLKTVVAALLALGVAMLLDLPQPRTAMTTVFVLMQPFSGMVIAKSFYRVLGTLAGMVAALVLGALFAQQPALYMPCMICWVSACIAAAVRYRHFRWYGFVLAGYTASLIGIPTVVDPNSLFLAALTRAAEVTVGILCSTAISALVVPQRSSIALQRSLHDRYRDFTAFAAQVLGGAVARGQFERRFAGFVDEIVRFEATRAFAAFEDPDMRSHRHSLARLNSEFMDLCARLHALHQLLKRLQANDLTHLVDAMAPYFRELAQLMVPETPPGAAAALAACPVVALRRFQLGLPKRVRQTRKPLERGAPDSLTDFDTSAELLYRFTDEFVRYAGTFASLAQADSARDRQAVAYVSKTNGFVTAFAFVRSVVVLGIVSWFWIETNWPSGGLAVIGAALACALTSTAPNPSRLTIQMAVGAAFATIAGYLYNFYVYPAIDGFPLLCATLAPVLALGAWLATRPASAGYGVGFSVFFCLLAGPDNVVTYLPEVLINNGIALVVSMAVAAMGFAVIFPSQMPWLISMIERDLRAQVVLASHGELDRLNQRFQSGTHDLMSQLRMLLSGRGRRHRQALRWMLITLEIGHALIDLRNEVSGARYAPALHPRWNTNFEQVNDDLARLFSRPERPRLERVLDSVQRAMATVQEVLEAVVDDRTRRHDMQRIVSRLHFIRTALLDKHAPFEVR